MLPVVQPEAVGTALSTASVVCLSGPVAIEGIEYPRGPVPQWVPNLPTHPNPTDLLEESSFAPSHGVNRVVTVNHNLTALFPQLYPSPEIVR